MSTALDSLSESDLCPLLKRWLIIGLGRLWTDFDAARWQAIRLNAADSLFELLADPVPEVRAASVYALGTLVCFRFCFWHFGRMLGRFFTLYFIMEFGFGFWGLALDFQRIWAY